MARFAQGMQIVILHIYFIVLMKKLHNKLDNLSCNVLGKFKFGEPGVYDKLAADSCVSLYYTDDEGKPTEKYPMNPNGSPGN